jgi:hypothetical protein
MTTFLTYLWNLHKRNKTFTKYLAQRAMIMRYISDGTGVTTDIDSYIIHTPCCKETVIKAKSTRLRSQEEPEPLQKTIKSGKKMKKLMSKNILYICLIPCNDVSM